MLRTIVVGVVLLGVAAGVCAGAEAFDVEQAVRAYLDQMSGEQRAKSDAYFEGGYWMILWNFLYTAAVMLLLLATGFSARMRDWAARVTGHAPLQTFLYWLQFLLAITLLRFPLDVYQEYFREHAYQLSNQTFGAWLGDSLKAFGVSAIFSGLLIVALLAIVKKMERTWWIWGTGVTVVFLAIALVVSPVYIAPLFNTYQKLGDSPIRDRILSLARANGIPAGDVYEMDASRQSKRISANVSGFLGTERITLNDNLLSRCTPAEIEAVMGHEIGHYVLNHSYKMLLAFGLLALLIFAWLNWSLRAALGRWGARWRIRAIHDPAVLPLVFLLVAVIGFFLTPVTNTLIRVNEQEADVFGLNAARQPDGFATVTLKLAEYRKLAPGPIEELLFYDHPSGLTRLRTAMRWKAENLTATPSESAPAAPAPPAQ